ncbi:hypothetical protein [Saccharothrix xinjiangensis]|uniref:TerD domain-containing protein n=1 Tax=Saccharothrix xinjiangensis TaxID=204798 RepID=A0ABV9Y4I4_9PSEU
MTEDATLIQKTLRVPRSPGSPGDGRAVARQFDAALLQVGFKASGDLLRHVSGLSPAAAGALAGQAVAAVRELVADHVAHNPYFRDFPRGVPDTTEFWLECLRQAIGDAPPPPVVDLLRLPAYGRVQHSYEDLLAAHDDLVPSVKDRLTVLHLGGTADEEARSLYRELATSATPLREEDLVLLADLARLCVDDDQPDPVPVRENRAVLNAVRLAAGRPLVAVDTVTDVLRLACAASGGDVTLAAPTRFRSFRRAERRALMAALDAVVAANHAKLGDVTTHRGRWQRLGERLHPHEHDAFPHARDVFAVARGDREVRSFAGRVELAFAAGDVRGAVRLLSTAPGLLLRSLDRVLRSCAPDDVEDVVRIAGSVLGDVSGRVLCSVREHLVNRTAASAARVFVNKEGRGWVTPDERPGLDRAVVDRLTAAVDGELLRRLPAHDRLVVDPDVLTLALPLSDKAVADGFGVMPRGSVSALDGELLRFFVHWRQRERRTDFDLSALLLDDDFGFAGQVSWTDYGSGGAHYSGDLTEAPDGATEFIDVPLGTVTARYVVPQVNIFSGEGFADVAESVFGFMTRDLDQRGRPFEPSTVRTRSDLRGAGRVAVPLVFRRDDDGSWSAKWLHLYQRGATWGNRVEDNRMSVSVLVRSLVEHRSTTVGHVVELLRAKAGAGTTWTRGMVFTEPVTFIGVERPEGLPAGSTVITLATLRELVPR